MVRKIVYATLGVCLAVSNLAVRPASAEEQIRTLYAGESWSAFAHASSMMSPPDACVLTNAHRILLRGDEDGIDFRVLDESWSLPSKVEGQITVDVGTQKFVLDIDSNTNNMVSTSLDQDDAIKLFKAMDEAASMSVKVGNAAPQTISLAGSTKATNAFRTCQGMDSSKDVVGANPFAGPPQSENSENPLAKGGPKTKMK